MDLCDSCISPAMRQILDLASRVALVDSTVLITGETGVGKERLARWVHDRSPRRDASFVAVNCGAFSDTLLETELFGHARGAFTGAIADTPGVFEAASGGTLFLDEIGEMSPLMQTRMLRVVQEREVRRVGETRVRAVNVRLIAATHRNLDQEVALQHFRADLLYRLRIVELQIPPLRERPAELRALALDLLTRTAARLKRTIVGFTPAALDCISAYPWPGNIRELEHAIERACVVTDSREVDSHDLPEAVSRQVFHALLPEVMDERECEYIREAVDRHQGRRRLAAVELGISLSTLNRRLRRWKPLVSRHGE